MAYQTSITCTICKRIKTITIASGGTAGSICTVCKQIKEDEKREKYFAKLDKLSIEERIRRIEEWIYDYRPTYISPPRF